MTTPPQHRADGPLRYIPPGPHWNRDRYLSEVDGLAEDEAEKHAFRQYLGGESRYDLDATDHQGRTAREYLRTDVPHPVVLVRRLPIGEQAFCKDEGGRKAWILAFRHAVKGIEGVEGLRFDPPQGSPCSMHDVDEVALAMGTEAVYQIGIAVLAMSAKPMPREGKPSGS